MAEARGRTPEGLNEEIAELVAAVAVVEAVASERGRLADPPCVAPGG
jgi:hypothetical protein